MPIKIKIVTPHNLRCLRDWLSSQRMSTLYDQHLLFNIKTHLKQVLKFCWGWNWLHSTRTSLYKLQTYNSIKLRRNATKCLQIKLKRPIEVRLTCPWIYSCYSFSAQSIHRPFKTHSFAENVSVCPKTPLFYKLKIIEIKIVPSMGC